ncbi:YheC/YheD family protein [Paenibacillus harenae]|uniref:YheC/YheD family endospore coat-associated protein n=1 Tax=Paenibacillus harenae TaxID=306543 RepID=UPI00040CDF9F|nr:YheC/YheD family protein [Paenibacillus harenae]
MKKPIIGILAYRVGMKFHENQYFKALVREGQKLGATVFIFAHRDVINRNSVKGFTPSADGSGWKSAIYPRPEAVIDRCRRPAPEARGFRKRHNFLFANSKITNKWTMTQLFAKEESLKQWIPETRSYSRQNLSKMIEDYSMLYIKPGNGTGGRSVLKLTTKSDGYELLGRTNRQQKRHEHFKTFNSLYQYISRWVEKEKIRNGIFMIQHGLDLELLPNRVVDMRLLIQKNEHGIWEVTGQGIRVGGKNSPTSNLHGGGKAVTAESVLFKRFGETKGNAIIEESHRLAHAVVTTVEKHFGRMMELGLDVGVDVKGRIWLIEVNPKPGRDVFKKMGKMQLYRKTVQRPIQYAMYLIKNAKK